MDKQEYNMVTDVSDQVLSVEKRAGFFSKIGESEALTQLRVFLATPGIVGTVLAGELLQFLPDEGQYLSFAWKYQQPSVAAIPSLSVGQDIGVRTHTVSTTTAMQRLACGRLFASR